MEKILVIDDDADIRELLRHLLETEYEITTAENADRVLGLDLSGFDLILLDVMLGEADGFDLCIKIRDQVDCPILFLTAKNYEEDVTYGFSVGGDDYIRKPFSKEELKARIRAHLRREKREHTVVMTRGDIRFYLKQREAVYKEEKLPFTQSEYDIALLLAKHPGQVFSREEIYEAIYGFEKDGNDSAIAEHIKNIRRKMKDAGSNCIETVWGIGYRWRNEHEA